MPRTTGSETRTIGDMCTTKSAKVRPAALPIRMFGGSPMRVDAPPMFDAMTCVSKNGIGEASRASAIRNVTGTMRMTVVTLSRKAERNAVTMASSMRMRPGRALPHWALFMARYSKTPVRSRIATITIIPARSPMVFQSMNSLAACSWLTTPKATSTAAPRRASTVRWASSKAMNASTSTKRPIAKTSCTVHRIVQFVRGRVSQARDRGNQVDREPAPRRDIRVEDVMRPVVSVGPETTAREVLKILRDNNIPGVPVVNDEGELEGFVTDGHLMESALPRYMKMMGNLSFVPEDADEWIHYLTDAADKPVREVMSREVSQVPLGRSELAVAHRMVHDGVSSVVITDGGRVVGIVNRLDLYAAIEGID